MNSKTSVVRISRQLDERLEALAAKTGRSKSHYASKAIAQFLEDREDYLLAVAAYEESRGKRTYSLEEARKELGLDRPPQRSRSKRTQETRAREPKPNNRLSGNQSRGS